MNTVSSDLVPADQVSEVAEAMGKSDNPIGAAPRDRRGFWALIATQFQGAFSDNILRNLLLSIIVGMSLAKTERETLRFRGHVSVLGAVPDSQHAGRMAGGPLQQTADHDLDQGDGVRIDAAGDGRAGDAHAGAFAGGADAGGEPGGAVWAVEVWPAAGAAAREEPVVGQRRHRAGNVPGDHCWHGRRRVDGGALSRARSLCGLRAAGLVGDWIRDEPGHRQRAGGSAAKNHSG